MAKDIKGKLKKQVEAMEIGMSKPRIYISSEMLPAIKDWKIGEKYDIMIKVKQESMRQIGGDDGLEASFEVLSAKVDEDED
jgi:hypothetical protein